VFPWNCVPARRCARSGWVLCGLAVAASSTAVAATLVRDINAIATPLNSEVPGSPQLKLGALTLMVMDDGVHGGELWASDGTTQGTRLLKDINPGPTGSDINYFNLLGEQAVFFANDGTNGNELWVSDGTAAGTHIVANVDGSPYSTSQAPAGTALPQMGGAVFFVAADATSGDELWRSDGTAAGTWRVKDINPGNASAEPAELTVLGSHLFFTADDGTSGREVWVTDGTPSGTHLVHDIAAGALSSNPAELTPTDTGLYFRADDRTAGPELWWADAAGQNASLVRDFIPGTNGSYPTGITAFNSGVVYSALTSGGFPAGTTGGTFQGDLFYSDGTKAGTLPIGTAHAELSGSGPSAFRKIGNRMVFHINAPAGVSALWSTDGTAGGTVPLSSLPLDFYIYSTMTEIGGRLYFYALSGPAGSDVNIWRTDGTPDGTALFAAVPQPELGQSNLVSLNNKLYFSAGTCCTGNGTELWTSDGTVAGTMMIKDINPGVAVSGLTALSSDGTSLHFFANDGVHGLEPWISDGTSDGTVALGDFNPLVLTAASNPVMMATLSGKELFSADDGVHGTELWVSDGTSAGTQLLVDIDPGADGSQPGTPALVMSGVAYFAANDGTHGNELWRSDGTASGTYMVADLYPGTVPDPVCDPRLYCPPPATEPPASSDPWLDTDPTHILGGRFYFSADDGAHGRELWSSDGTSAGTLLVTDLTAGSAASYITIFGASSERLYFCVNDGTGTYPWSTDGTAAGTVRVGTNVLCDVSNGSPQGVVVQNVFYFSGHTDASGAELWRSDGTVNGTYMVIDLAPGADSSAPGYFGAISGRLTFSACASSGNCALYVSDGTAAGTASVPGVPVPVAPPQASSLGLLYEGMASATTIVTYISDGTVAGTRQPFPANLLPNGVYLGSLHDYLGHVVFQANDGVHGNELWVTDGTASGTRAVFNPLPGVSNGNDFFSVAELGSTLLFSATDALHGSELWSLPGGAPTANPDAVNGAYGASTTIDVLANDGYVSSPLDPSSVTITSGPAHGTVTVDTATGAISYQPETGFSGQDQVTYQVSDRNGLSSNAAVAAVVVAAPEGSTGGTAPVDTGSGSSSSGGTGSGATSGGSKGGGGGALSWLELFLLVGVAALSASRSADARSRAHRTPPSRATHGQGGAR